ncbi:MAG: hypothetical protein JWM04_2132 [Verrucomicrobiales bacterium]|nr:hypothetical protein [Verrucomicrobiales bacterium]
MTIVGISWWLILPVAAVCFFLLRSILRKELSPLPKGRARLLLALRITALFLLLFVLLEPTLRHHGFLNAKPTVAILLDQSGSMNISDRQLSSEQVLAEAKSMGLVADSADIQNLEWDHFITQLESLRADPKDLSGTGKSKLSFLASEADLLAKRATSEKVLSVALRETSAFLQQLAASSNNEKSISSSNLEKRVEALMRLKPPGNTANQVNLPSNLTNGPSAIRSLTRLERARAVITNQVIPAFGKSIRVKLFAFDEQSQEMTDLTRLLTSPEKQTDFDSSLRTVGELGATENLQAAIIVTDGRQTIGKDPGPVLRSLLARGIPTYGIQVGSTNFPADAVISSVSGSSEILKDEMMDLEVKLRVSGLTNSDWELLISQNGAEMDRRLLHPTGDWQIEKFHFKAENAGLRLFQARLQPYSAETGIGKVEQPSGTILRQQWNNVAGAKISDFYKNNLSSKPPTVTETVGFERITQRKGDNYFEKLSGYIHAPVSGNYTFWITGDESCEFHLSPTTRPADKRLVAYAEERSTREDWTRSPSQQSTPITLQANKKYYFELLHKEAAADDFVSIGWRQPDGAYERPISPSRISPFKTNSEPGTVTAAQSMEADEASSLNNSGEHVATVTEDPIQVLILDATPRWESRYLAAMFEHDQKAVLTRRYRSIYMIKQAKDFLPATQDEWNRYDAVILGDLTNSELPNEAQQQLVNYVSKRGGFLVCLAGYRGMPSTFGLGPLSKVLPVRLLGQGNSDRIPITLALGLDGEESPMCRILNDPGLNKQMWTVLPPLQWHASGVAAKPAATVLLQSQNANRTPIVAYHPFGAGKVFWMGTSESWRWRDRLGDVVHQKFWQQAVRWGLTGRLRGKSDLLKMSIDRSLVELGGSAEIRARALKKDGKVSDQPINLTLAPVDDKGVINTNQQKTVSMTRSPDSSDLWQYRLSGLPEGKWALTVNSSEPELARASETREIYVKKSPGRELENLSADLVGLERTIHHSGQVVVPLSEARQLADYVSASVHPRAFPQTRTYTLWDNYFIIIIVSCVLAMEWVLRRRFGLP